MTEEFRPLFKNTKFAYIWFSQILSQLTINIVNFLLITTLFKQTGSTIATSLLWIAYALPAIIVGPFGAAASDMLDKRRVLMFANLTQSVVIFGYAVLATGNSFLPYGVVLAYSLLNQFYVPAEASAIPSLVSKKLLPLANGLFFMTQQAAIVLGFGLAGVLNHFLGFQKSLFLCAAFLAGGFLSVSFLPKLTPAQKAPSNLEDTFFQFFRRILEGYNFIKANNKILMPFGLLLSLQVILTVMAVNVPAIVTDLLNININSMGVALVVPAGLGTAFGAFVFPKLLKKGLRKRRLIDNSLAGLAVCFILIPLLLPLIPGGARLIGSSVLIFLAGLSFIGIVIPSQTFLQEVTPGGLRGRVFGNFWFVVTVATLLPVLFSGTITELLGIRVLLVLLSVLTAAGLFVSKKYAYRLIQHKLNVSNLSA